MSRQFRSDDTSKWLDGFGNGRDSNLNYTGGNFGGVSGHGFATFSGTSGQYTGTFSDQGYFDGSNGGRVGDIVLIHQTQGSSAGNWELNKIIGRSGSTLTFKYPLQNTYTSNSSNKAQIVSSGQFVNVTLSGTTTPYLAWNGSAGGIFFLVVKNILTIDGNLTVSWYGFKGGVGGTSYAGYTGESSVGPMIPYQWDPNGSGGGAGEGDNAAYQQPGGGGGGHGTNGQNGNLGSCPPGEHFGYGGYTVGISSLTTIFFGGGGGQGAGRHIYPIYWYPGGVGGEGGGIILVLAKQIIVNGNITANGENGSTGSHADSGAGGGGAGGSILIKSQIATIGSSKVVALGGSKGEAEAGDGGVGRIHLDYMITFSGSTNPTIDVRQDSTLNDIYKGSFLFSMLN